MERFLRRCGPFGEGEPSSSTAGGDAVIRHAATQLHSRQVANNFARGETPMSLKDPPCFGLL